MSFGYTNHLLEVGASSDDFVHKIFDTQDVVFAKCCFDHAVVGQRDALFVDFAVTAFVDQLSHRLEVGLAGKEKVRVKGKRRGKGDEPVCDIRFDKTQHLLSCSCHLDKYTAVDLQETEELHDFTGLWCNLVDTEEENEIHRLEMEADKRCLTREFGLQNTPWAELGRRSLPPFVQPALNGPPLAPL